MSQLEDIEARVTAYTEHGTPGLAAPADRDFLFALVREQAAKLNAVKSIADAVASAGFTIYYTGQDVDDMIHNALEARA